MSIGLDHYKFAAEFKYNAWDELASSFRAKSDLLKAARDKFAMGYEELQKKRDNISRENGGENLSDEDMIHINAGGEIVLATRGTLTHLKGSLMEALFSGRWEKKLLKDAEGRVFLDVNPACFRNIIDYIHELKVSPPGSSLTEPSVNDDNKLFTMRLMSSSGLSTQETMGQDDPETQPTTQPLPLEQWQTLSFDEFPEKVRVAFEQEQASLIGVQEALTKENAFFEKEKDIVSRISSGRTEDIVHLNVSGVRILTRRSTLGIYEDSVLAKQFNDPKWMQQGNESKIITEVEEWSCEEVSEWVEGIKGVPNQVAETIRTEQVTGAEILAMKRDDFKDIGINRAGTLALLTSAIDKLKNQRTKSPEVLIEQSPYCFQKIVDHLRLIAMRQPYEPMPPAPHVNPQERKHFRKVVEFYFPGQTAEFLLYGGGTCIDSDILSKAHAMEVQKWIEEEDAGSDFTLCYRASRDGWKPTNFHSCCANRGATVTVIRSVGGYIFGGFTDIPWSGIRTTKGDWKHSSKTFLFALKGWGGVGPKKIPQISYTHKGTVWHNSEFGPAFGTDYQGGSKHNLCDLLVMDNGYIHCNIGPSGAFEKLGFLAERPKFKAAEIEVFRVD
mmetsp:Transcript_4429/g.7734  ORF Transcript_4429/g.7734 Transcript_4429/m.7734 type:complete len:613 (-) Transcript_4429:273-2111(-)|eukprot:CAMPEP_0197448074 /NCGR_PEP_ID=MMETSP1175-20131217/16007_1 /TAXON_ID=1003142 /ORGANISM="Triceratium dubium, Strain CCMP147" /LENGTH=612 /DNA_ID=CAMNT_0042979695 /DNA_START=93 /DNA_END=1931 /DNA_ORIENTATION=+